MKWKSNLILAISLLTSSCAVLHRTQIANIDNTSAKRLRKVDVIISETGVSLDEAGNIVRSLSKNKKFNKNIEDALAIVKMFQMGPRTGLPVFSDDYARNLNETLIKECPSGKLVNIVSIRETNKYPVISGEIIRIIADCKS